MSEDNPKIINPWRLWHGAFVPNWLLLQTGLSQGSKLCYARLCQFAGKDGKCFPSQAKLAAELGVSRVQCSKYIRELERLKLIVRIRRGCNLVNQYYFLDHPFMGLHPDANNSLQPDVNNGLQPDAKDSLQQDVNDGLQGIDSIQIDSEKDSVPKEPYVYYAEGNRILKGVTRNMVNEFADQYKLDFDQAMKEIKEFQAWLEDDEKYLRIKGNLHSLINNFFYNASGKDRKNWKRKVGRDVSERRKLGTTASAAELLANCDLILGLQPGPAEPVGGE